MSFFDKEKYDNALKEYYETCYGYRNTDVWFEQPGVNVWVFERDNQIITLKSDILSGNVTEYIEVRQGSDYIPYCPDIGS